MSTEIEIENTKNTNTKDAQSVCVAEYPAEVIEIFDYLSLNDKIVFKSQQRNDPELQRTDKVEIAKSIYSKNRQTFLMRFGSFLNEHHLKDFENIVLHDNNVQYLKNEENYNEMQLLVENYKRKLHTRKQVIKNRRYAAMQELVEQGEYFSEPEMMKRKPELYQELIGQYLTKEEKDTRDSYDVKNTTFSGILMHAMEREEMQAVLTEADVHNKSSEIQNETKTEHTNTKSSATVVPAQATLNEVEVEEDEEEVEYNDEVYVPESYRQQWGNFDNELVPCSRSRERKVKLPIIAQVPAQTVHPVHAANLESTITIDERNLLRQEFVDLMVEQFLAGEDKDFDYTQVDDNSELDNLKQLNQDKEDAYFDSSDNDNSNEVLKEEVHNTFVTHDNESEDELELFMNHLNKHHSLQNQQK